MEGWEGWGSYVFPITTVLFANGSEGPPVHHDEPLKGVAKGFLGQRRFLLLLSFFVHIESAMAPGCFKVGHKSCNSRTSIQINELLPITTV